MRFGKSVWIDLMWVAILLITCSVGTAMGANAASSLTGDRSEQAMTTGQAAILGVVEGLTEYLPVSSTGHLLLTQRLMGIGEPQQASAEEKQRAKDAADAYAICIQAGAIIAVLGLYFRRVRHMLLGLLGRNADGRRLLINVIAGFIPGAVLALLFNKTIKSYLFGPWPVVVAWFVGGVAILVVS